MTEPSGETVLVYTTWPDADMAEAVAAEAIAERLAACANILSPMRSIYRWEGAVDRAAEVPMLLKTSAEASERLRDFIVAKHPYDVPCVVAVPVSASMSNPAFLAWIARETGSQTGEI